MSTRTDYLAQADSERQNVVSKFEMEVGLETAYLNELVNSHDLDALIVEARAANPDFQQTRLSLQILRAQYRATQADQLPDVEAGFVANNTDGLDTAYTVSISWELDLWSKISDEASAAASDVAEQLALYQAARDTLAAEVMQGWLKLVNLNRSVAIEKQRAELLEKNEQWILQRYRSGLGDLEDLDSAQSSAASARATLIAVQESLQQQQRALNLLLGRSQASTVISADYPQVLLPLSDLTEQTLQRRPDLKAAYMAIRANDFRTSVAYKDMLPSINLETALSETGTSPSDALLRNPVWSLLGQLTAPLSRLHEFYYELLKGEAGHSFRNAFGVGNEIARSIEFLSSNLDKTVTIEDLADQAGMSRAVFHRKFKQATNMSPIQFLKSMRLNKAAMKIAEGQNVSVAAMDVGYLSSSQFSREFKRLYGLSPKQWSQTEKAS
ncbi:hypothetical protein Q673_10960 [Marinobacter sp. EN3]|uniref:TolC family protein n=1 Tax=Marinobacter sp. EN3 TaxID=1397533 RepID=UPI0003B91EFE|nr:TolC family protein [Marinobacter sp. EN3]ERS11482.1 hypothetical protein Q673_10960 [Marinobacter sp. EN3]